MKKTACLWLALAMGIVPVLAQNPAPRPLAYVDTLRLQTLVFPLSSAQLAAVGKKEWNLLAQGGTEISLRKKKSQWEWTLEAEGPVAPVMLSHGENVQTRQRKKETRAVWSSAWASTDSVYVCLTHLADSASKTTVQALYLRPASQTHWKLVAAVKRTDSAMALLPNKELVLPNGQALLPWGQSNRGRWYQLLADRPRFLESTERPTIDLMRNADSAWQAAQDRALVLERIAQKEIDTTGSVGGVWYQILQPGTGAKIQVSDTTTVHYKGWCLLDGTVFDQTKDKPASFPLSRLIKGWQLGVPMIKVGGKVRLFIPSALAYGMRTRSPKIPPNAVLVFDVEVLAAQAQR